MAKWAISIYLFLKKNRLVFYVTLLASTLFFVYFGSKIEFEEDISKLLPSTEESTGTEKVVFANLKVKDKLFLLFSPELDTVSSEDLAAASSDFVEFVLRKDSANKEQVIEDALYKIDDNLWKDGLTFLFGHLPLFLDSTDYVKMDTLLTKEQVDNRMSENFMTLLSPAGMAFSGMITKDPLAFRTIFIEKLGRLQEGLGGDYIVNDNHFFTPDSAIALAFISPNFQSFNSKESIKLIKIVEEGVKQFAVSHPDIKISYHGAPVQSVYNSRQIKKDLATTVIVSLIIICFIIFYCFRNKSSLVYLLLPVVYGTFFSFAVIYFIKGSMSLQAVGIGAVVLGVALSYCLHVITQYKYGCDPVIVLRDQTVPVFLSCLTTVGAFCALLFTKAELLQDFGLFASLALIGTTFFSLVFLPQFFNPEKNKHSEKAFAFLEKINSYPLEKQTWLIIALVVLSVVCVFTSRYVTFDADLKNIGYHEPKVIESQKLLTAHTLPGYETTYYASVSKDLDVALSNSKRMDGLLDSLQREKKVRSYSKASSLFMPISEQKEKNERWNKFWTTEKKTRLKKEMDESGAAVGLNPELFQPFWELIDKDYQPVSMYESHVIPSSILSNMIEYTDSTYIVYTSVQLKPENQKEVSRVIAGDKDFIVIDPFYYTQDMVKIISDDFNVTLVLSSLFVLLVLLVSYRSVMLSALAFLPMVLSWYIVLGVMGIFGLQFNLINIIVSSFIFGIGVDYTIFVMDGLLAGFQTRTRKQLLIYHKTAIFFSAVVLIIGIASLLFATHPAISSIGLSTLIGMVTVVLIAYSLQPFLFYWLIKRPVLHKRAPITIYNILHADSYWGKKGFNAVQKMRNNYAYKGNNVEQSLRRELKKTCNYALFEPYFDKPVLEYKCGYGFIAYWFMMNGKNNCVTAYDSDKDAVSLARHCYLKNRRIHFTTDRISFLEEKFDVIVFNQTENMTENAVRHLIIRADVLIVRKANVNAETETLLQTEGFSETASDALFAVFKKAIG